MEDWREEWRERIARLSECCHAHPKETAETALLVVLLFVAGVWYVSSEDETIAVQPKEAVSTPQKEQHAPEARVAVKGAELAAEQGELTNPFSFEHETRAQMAAQPPKKRKDASAKDDVAKQGQQTPVVPPMTPSVPTHPTGTDATSSASTDAPAAPPLVLKGVAISETDAVAVVIEYGQRRFVGVGDTLGGMVVTAIDRDSVTLAGDEGTTVLRLPSYGKPCQIDENTLQ
ncbi:hypothetical protein [Selenomonas sp.]|uniref:hypothetical protein n=1 Tax=Selenomonas sp. TaxID=2053611 RepID=UPI0025CE4CA7|nr:hypothetical protein [Selenomonas sp.]MCI6285042.1 hypothetical protein [Selenomonas sp.]